MSLRDNEWCAFRSPALWPSVVRKELLPDSGWARNLGAEGDDAPMSVTVSTPHEQAGIEAMLGFAGAHPESVKEEMDDDDDMMEGGDEPGSSGDPSHLVCHSPIIARTDLSGGDLSFRPRFLKAASPSLPLNVQKQSVCTRTLPAPRNHRNHQRHSLLPAHAQHHINGIPTPHQVHSTRIASTCSIRASCHTPVPLQSPTSFRFTPVPQIRIILPSPKSQFSFHPLCASSSYPPPPISHLPPSPPTYRCRTPPSSFLALSSPLHLRTLPITSCYLLGTGFSCIYQLTHQPPYPIIETPLPHALTTPQSFLPPPTAYTPPTTHSTFHHPPPAPVTPIPP